MNINLFKYPILEILTKKDVPIKKTNKIYFCGYHINTSGLFPFLSYLLVRCQETDTLVFPTFVVPKNCDSILIFMTNSIDYLLKGSKKEYNGWLLNDGKMFMFYDVSNCNIQITHTLKQNYLWFGLIDEIINEKQICNIKVSTYVTDLFRNNLKLLFLKDENNKAYEIPIVAYVGKEITSLNFTYVFGVLRSNKKSNYYFYFTNFKKAIKQGGWIKPNIKGGIVRFALFPLKMKTRDDGDSFSINYDSDNNPTYITKEGEQQLALSYHHIDSKYLGIEFDNKREYFIL
jgi:hypothetical protein